MKRGLLLLAISFLFFLGLQGQEKFRRLPPYPEPMKEWRLPRLESATLANGLTVAVVSRRHSPFLSLQLIITAGESASPENLPGLATLTAKLLSRGTLLLSGTEIEEKIEAMGGELHIIASFDRTLFSFRFLEEYLDDALSLLSQMILQPAFASADLDAVRRSLFYELLEKKENADFLAQRQLLRWLFQGHPYQQGLFNEDLLRRISRRDILSFYDRHYRPENSVLVLGGNLNLSQASRKVSHYLNTWKREEANQISIPPLLPKEERLIGFIDLPRAKEITLVMGNVLSSRLTNDIFPFLVLNQVFGGSPHSRLFMNLRETRQLAYIAFSEIEIFKSGWVFLVQAKLPPPALSAGLKEIERELNRLVQEKLPTAEIEQAKSFLVESFPLDLEPLEALTRRAAEVLAFHLEEDHWNRWVENILTIEANRVTEVASRLLSVPLSVVIVGDSRQIGDFFQEPGQIKVYDRNGKLLYTISKGEEK